MKILVPLVCILFVIWMVSGLFQNRIVVLGEVDGPIWCYVKTVSSVDEVVLSSNQVAIYTRGGIDVMQKCAE